MTPLRDRFASIIGAIENSEGNFKEADAVEERIVEEMRLLGREAMQGSAENQVEATERHRRREKLFGLGRPVPLDRNAKVRIMHLAGVTTRKCSECTTSWTNSGPEQPRETTFALRMNGRTRFFSNRYCGSKTATSPNFVCQRSFFYLGDASELVDEFLA